ncbi:hypothetical protein FACS189432_08400 [Bacteroidia bacterium]|nr:hypothetical protein FACS189432_08400 [Bacteroidia bacterium]
MKKILLVMVLILPLAIQSCKEDEKDASLSGTEWVRSLTKGDYTAVTTFKFIDGTRFQATFSDSEGYGDEETGTYTVSGSKITLIFREEVLEGTINGNKMTFIDPTEPSIPIVFVKK